MASASPAHTHVTSVGHRCRPSPNPAAPAGANASMVALPRREHEPLVQVDGDLRHTVCQCRRAVTAAHAEHDGRNERGERMDRRDIDAPFLGSRQTRGSITDGMPVPAPHRRLITNRESPETVPPTPGASPPVRNAVSAPNATARAEDQGSRERRQPNRELYQPSAAPHLGRHQVRHRAFSTPSVIRSKSYEAKGPRMPRRRSQRSGDHRVDHPPPDQRPATDRSDNTPPGAETDFTTCSIAHGIGTSATVTPSSVARRISSASVGIA